MAGGRRSEEQDELEEKTARSWKQITRGALGDPDESQFELASLDFYDVGGVDPWLMAYMDMQDSPHLHPSSDEDDNSDC